MNGSIAQPLQSLALGKIRGTITGPDGQPVAKVRVRLTRRGETIEIRTDAQGHFRLTSLPVGTYQAEFSVEGFQVLKASGLRISPLDELDVTVDLRTKKFSTRTISQGKEEPIDVEPPPKRHAFTEPIWNIWEEES